MSHGRTHAAWVKIALAGVALVLSGLVALAGDPPRVVHVKVSKARVRSTPSIQGEIVTTVPFGTRLEAVEHIDNWYRIRLADGARGFIYDELVSKKDVGRGWIEESGAEVHAGPTAYSPVVATLEAGTELHPTGKRDDWYRVELESGKVGFVHEDAVDDDPPGVLYVRTISTRVHTGPSPLSEVMAEVVAGTELTRLAKVDDFFKVRMEGGRTGWVFEKAVQDEKPLHLFVDVPEAEVKSDPTPYGRVRCAVVSGTELVAFDKVDDFYLVRTPDGTLGWIYDDNVVRMGD